MIMKTLNISAITITMLQYPLTMLKKFCGIMILYQNHASNSVDKVFEPRTFF